MADQQGKLRRNVILDVDLGQQQLGEPSRRLIRWNRVTDCEVYNHPDTREIHRITLHLRGGQNVHIVGTRATQNFFRELQHKVGYEPAEQAMTGSGR